MGNDLYIFSMIVFVFFVLGAILPFISSDFDVVANSPDTAGYVNELGQSADDMGSIGFFDIVGSIGKMFFWTFGDVPFLIDAVLFLPLRLILLVIFVRWIRGVG